MSLFSTQYHRKIQKKKTHVKLVGKKAKIKNYFGGHISLQLKTIQLQDDALHLPKVNLMLKCIKS